MKLVWHESYNCHSAKVGRFTINANWSSDREKPGYKVSFSDIKLKEPIRGLTEARNAGVRLAKKILTETLEIVNSIEEETDEKV